MQLQDCLFLRRGAPHGSKSCRFRFHCNAQFEHIHYRGNPLMIDTAKCGRGRLACIKHKHTCAAPRLDQSISPQRGNGLTHHCAADTKILCNARLAGQFVAWLETFGGNFEAQCA